MKTLLAFAFLFVCGTFRAQAAEPDSVCSAPRLPEYAYCEIVANHLPTAKAAKVLFDFGQATPKWNYNFLRDDKGADIRFVSGIQALNYMTVRGWEFVQAFAAGENTESIHYLLRIPVAKLTAEQQQQLLAEPDAE